MHTLGPQFSTLNTVGALGITLGSNAGFDISTSGSTTLYSIDLVSGAVAQQASLGCRPQGDSAEAGGHVSTA